MEPVPAGRVPALEPRDTPSVTMVRELRVFDNLHSPGGEAELLFEDVRVPVSIADGPDEVHMSQLGKLTIRDLVG